LAEEATQIYQPISAGIEIDSSDASMLSEINRTLLSFSTSILFENNSSAHLLFEKIQEFNQSLNESLGEQFETSISTEITSLHIQASEFAIANQNFTPEALIHDEEMKKKLGLLAHQMIEIQDKIYNGAEIDLTDLAMLKEINDTILKYNVPEILDKTDFLQPLMPQIKAFHEEIHATANSNPE